MITCNTSLGTNLSNCASNSTSTPWASKYDPETCTLFSSFSLQPNVVISSHTETKCHNMCNACLNMCNIVLSRFLKIFVTCRLDHSFQSADCRDHICTVLRGRDRTVVVVEVVSSAVTVTLIEGSV